MGEESTAGVMMEAAAPHTEADQGSEPTQFSAPQDTMVPLTALQAERRERQQMEEQNRMLQEHMALLRAQQAPAPQEPILNADDNDILTVGDFKKALGTYKQQYEMSIQELKAAQKYSDYAETVQKYLPDVIKQNPSLRDTLLHDPNKFETAYWLAKNSEAYRQDHKQSKKNADAERIIQNASKPGSLSAVGQSAGKAPAQSYKSMSDDEFRRLAARNAGSF